MNSDQLIHLLYQTTRAISQGLNQTLADHGLYSSEWSVIKAIKEKGTISQITLANYLNIEPAAISKTLVKLEEKGFVERGIGSDKREKKVFLTEKGLSEFPVWEKVVEKHRQAILADLSEEKQNQLYEMVQSIYVNTQKYKD